MDVFDLSASITLDSTKYDKGLSTAETKAKGFGGKLKTALKGGAIAFGAITAGVTAVSAAFGKGIKDTAAYGDNVDKMSQKLGLSAEGFQKWDYVLKIAGTDINSMSTGLKTLTNKIDDAKNGGSDAQEMFSKLGISMEELNKMSREEAFEATIKGFQGMADSTERAALANDLFGKSGQNLTPLFNQSAKATEEQLRLAEEYGMVMPEATVKASAAFEDSITTMQMTMQGMRNRMMGEFLPSITKVTDGLATMFTGDMSGIENVKAGIGGIVDKIAELLPKIIEIGGQIIGSLANSILESMPQLVSQTVNIITTFVTQLVEGLPKVLEMGVQIVNALVQGLLTAIPKITTALANNAGTIVTAGVDIIIALVEGLIKAIPKVIEALPKIITALLTAIIDNLPRLIIAGVKLIVALVKGLIQAIPQLIKMAPKIIKALVTAIGSLIGQLISAGAKLIGGLISGIGSKVKDAVGKAKDLIVDIKDAIVKKVKDFLDVGKAIIEGIWNGMKDKANWLKEQIKSLVGNVKKFLKKLFGIKSPSKWARNEIGYNIAEGLALGIKDGQGEVEDAMSDLMPDYTVDTSVVNGGLNDALQVSITGAVQGALEGLTPVLQQGMMDAMENVKVKLNGRNFGRLTREAVDGTI